MNRITNVLAAAIPSSSNASDVSSNPPAPSVGSPDLSVTTNSGRPSLAPGAEGASGWTNASVGGAGSGYERTYFQSLIYDDPRQTHFYGGQDRLVWPPALGFGRDRSGSRRPPHLRHVSDNPATASAGPGVRSGGATPNSRLREERDRSVRADLGGKKGQNRLGGLVKGTEGRYALGGPQCLKIIHISAPNSGTASPTGGSPNRGRTSGAVLARGAGGVRVTEVANLWKSSWSISKGVNDLDWGAGAFNNKLVTATPSGGFLIFDVNKARLDREIHGGSPRPLNRVHLCPHPTYGHLLLTGSAEGQAKLWDLRENNPHQKKYYKHSTAVTALAFSPDEPQSLVVGTENGTIKRYDLRMAPKPVGTLWGAHGNKPVMDVKWKGALPGDGGGFMASAGADKVVQVWDMAQQWDRNPAPLHTLHTALPPRRIAWRPDHPTELAIVPLQLALGSDADPEGESTVEVYDVRRHHVAKYALLAGRSPAGATTATGESGPVDAVWGEDAMGLVTAFSAGAVAQLDMRSRILPLESLPRQTVAWSMRGEVAYAVDRFKSGEIPFDDLKSEYANHWDKVGRRPKGVADPPYQPLQAVGIVPMPEVEEDHFKLLAERYRLEGGTAVALCLHNQAVATLLDRVDDVRLWAFLARLMVELGPLAEGDSSMMATFDEDIFSHPLEQAPHIPSPPSPSGSPRGGSTRLPTPNDSRARSPVSKQRRYVSAGITLDRVAAGEDSDRVEELASPSLSPRRSSAGFASFKPIDSNDRRLSLADPRASVATIRPGWRSRESTATIVAPRFARHFSGGSNKAVVEATEPERSIGAAKTIVNSAPQSANRSLATSPKHASTDMRRASLASSPSRSRTGSHSRSRSRHNSHGESNAPGASHSYRDRKISDKSSSGKSTASHAGHHGIHDYPDPYGFIPSLGAVTGSSSRTATETSASSRNATRDPSPAPAKMHAGSLGASLSRAMPSAIATAAAAAMAPGGSMRMSSATNTNTESSRNSSGDKGRSVSVAASATAAIASSPKMAHGIGAEPGSVKKSSGLGNSSQGATGAGRESRNSVPTTSSGTTTTGRSSSDARTSLGGPRDSKLGSTKHGHNHGHAGEHGWMTNRAWKEYKSARCALLLQWWRGLVDEGNVQLAVMILVISSGLVDFPPKQSERLVHAYVDMLDRYRLPVQSAYMRKYASVASLQITAPLIGVTHLVHCQKCGKSTGSLDEIGQEREGKKFWFCAKCKATAKRCAICRQPSRGLHLSCAKCKHGGHHACMHRYFGGHAEAQLSSLTLNTAASPQAIGHSASGIHLPLQRTHSHLTGGSFGALHSGIVREGPEGGTSTIDESGFSAASASAFNAPAPGHGTVASAVAGAAVHAGAQRTTHTPGHSGFAQLPGRSTVATDHPVASSHDSSNYNALNTHGRAGYGADGQLQTALGVAFAEDRAGGAAGERSGVMETVPVTVTTKCPEGCGSCND